MWGMSPIPLVYIRIISTPLSAYAGQGGIIMVKRLPILYSALLLTGVNLLLRFVSTSFQVHITTKIGPEGIGLLQLVMSVGSLALTAGMAGIRTTAMYLTAEELGKKRPENIKWVMRSCYLYSILCSGTIAAVMYFFAPWIATHWIGNSGVSWAVRIFSINLPLVCICGCLTGYFTASNRIGSLAIVEIGEQFCYMAFTLLALNFWADTAEQACACVVVGSGVSAIFTIFCLAFLHYRENLPTGPKVSIHRRLLSCAVPLAVADNIKSGISTLENLLVPKRLALYAGEISPLATFGRVCGMVFPILMFPAAILFALAELLIPELARCSVSGNKTRIHHLAQKSLRIAMLYGFLCGGILFLVAKPLCQRIYGDEAAGEYLRWYAFLAPMLYCDAITDAMSKGLGKQHINVRYNIITSAMDVALLFMILPKMGMTGYFISFLVTHAINFLLSLNLLSKTVGFSIPFYYPVYAGFATIAAVISVQTARGCLAQVIAFLGLSVGLYTLLGVVSGKDLRWIISLIHKKKSPVS